MEIRHQDIFPWNQLNIHILVVYSDAKLSIFGKKHSKVEESRQMNWLTLRTVASAMVWDWSNLSKPLLILPPISLCFGTTYMQEDMHTSKSTQAQLVTWLFYCRIVFTQLVEDKNTTSAIQWLIWSVLFCWATLIYHLGNESGVTSAHDSHATLYLLWGLW